MSIKLVDMAHYGRYFSYDERKYPIWWYDRNTESPIFFEDLLRKCSIDDASKIDYEALIIARFDHFEPFAPRDDSLDLRQKLFFLRPHLR